MMLSLEVFWLQACIVCDNKKFCFRLNIWLSGNEVIVLFLIFIYLFIFKYLQFSQSFWIIQVETSELTGRPNLESLKHCYWILQAERKKYKQATIKRKRIKSDHVTHPLQGLMFSTVFPYLLFSIKKIDFSWI